MDDRQATTQNIPPMFTMLTSRLVLTRGKKNKHGRLDQGLGRYLLFAAGLVAFGQQKRRLVISYGLFCDDALLDVGA